VTLKAWVIIAIKHLEIMKKSILELKGVNVLTKNEQKSINGGANQRCCNGAYASINYSLCSLPQNQCVLQ
jgi:hypothetical protein